MKRFLSMVLCAAVALTASGCSEKSSYDSSSSSNSSSISSSSTETQHTTPEIASSYNSSEETDDSTIEPESSRLYSTAPILAENWCIIPDSFDIYGRVCLDKPAYWYYEGDVPKDPYRLTLTLKATNKNWYFIQRIYMDTLIFDINGETIKSYHTEYACHDMTENLNKIETWGFDNSNPMNQGYRIKENWSDFPENAYSAAVLLSFDVFAKTEFGISTPDYNITVPPYEIRYVMPQAFDSFMNINGGILFEHR